MRAPFALLVIGPTLAACAGDLHENIDDLGDPKTETVATAPPSAPLHFDTDIQADIDRFSCSMVGCHGSGLGNFWLLKEARGDDLTKNFEAFTLRAKGGELSKLLIKATGGEGHVGGTRFTKADPVFARWVSWINQGSPR